MIGVMKNFSTPTIILAFYFPNSLIYIFMSDIWQNLDLFDHLKTHKNYL